MIKIYVVLISLMEIPEVDWQCAIDMLRKIREDELPPGFGVFYKKYVSYDALSGIQKMRAKEYFMRLPTLLQEKVIQGITARKAGLVVESVTGNASTREPITTKNDKCR